MEGVLSDKKYHYMCTITIISNKLNRRLNLDGCTPSRVNFITFPGSFMEPFPLMKTRQPVDASTRFRELPRGPKMRPTKLNCDRREYY
jgi:hypothetical protein